MNPPPLPPPVINPRNPTFLLRCVGLLLVALLAGVAWNFSVAYRDVAAAKAALSRGESTLALGILETDSFFAELASESLGALRGQAWEAEAEARLRRADFAGARVALKQMQAAAGTAGDRGRSRALAARIDEAETTAFVDQGDCETAVQLQLRRGDRQAAAETLVRGGRTDEAAGIFRDLRQPKRAVEALIAGRHYAQAAELLERELADRPAAIEQWRAAGRQAAEAREWLHAAEYFAHAMDEGAAREAWVAAAREAARQGNWTEAARNFERGRDWPATVDAMVRCGRTGDAWQVIDRHVDDPLTRARCNLVVGRTREAAQGFNGLGLVDETAAAYRDLKDWDALAALLRPRGRLAEAAEMMETAGEDRPAAEAWRECGRDDRACAALRRLLVTDLRNRKFAEVAARIKGQTNPGFRQALVAAIRGDFDPADSFELATMYVLVEQWPEAAAGYERAGAFLAAGEAWSRAKRPAESARVLVAAAQTSGDPYLTLRAIDARRRIAPGPEAELLELALNQALATDDFAAVAVVGGQLEVPEAGILRLLAIAESRAESRPYEASAAVAQAVELLRPRQANPKFTPLVVQANRVAARVQGVLAQLPRVVMERSDMSNRYGEGNRFVQTFGTVVLENKTGRRIPRLRLTLLSFERAPDLYFGSTDAAVVPAGPISRSGHPTTGDSPNGWGWNTRVVNDTYARTPPAFRHAETVTDLVPGEVRTVRVAMSNTMPYRRWRAVVSEETPAETSGAGR